MFARLVTFRLKSNMVSDYTRTFEAEIVPLLRKQKGFRDEIALSNPGSQDAIAISLWENKEDAETYNTNTFPTVLKMAQGMIEGAPKVQTYEVVTSTLHKLPAAA